MPVDDLGKVRMSVEVAFELFKVANCSVLRLSQIVRLVALVVIFLGRIDQWMLKSLLPAHPLAFVYLKTPGNEVFGLL